MQRKVGILGSGQVGKTLAKAFMSTGYEVKIGSRSPEKLESTVAEVGGKIYAGTFDQAATFGEIVVVATNGAGTENAIDLAGPKNFSGKTVIDASNPLDFSRGMPPSLLAEFNTSSLGEMVQRKLQNANVVKCFNTIPSTEMFNPRFKGAEMLICGNDKGAKEEVTGILKKFGWQGSIDLGGIENARWLEALVILWVKTAVATQAWDSMFMLAK